jgi:hypothetical protein
MATRTVHSTGYDPAATKGGRRSFMKRQLRVLARTAPIVALVLAVTGCGGGGGGGPAGPSPEAPVISNLQIRALDPETPNRNIRYVVAFNFTDRSGDVGGGQCEVLLNDRSIGRVTINPAGGADPNATQGAVACGFIVNAATPQQIAGRTRIFDRAGNQSNELTFTLGIHAEVPKGAIPEGQKGSFESRMGTATLSR